MLPVIKPIIVVGSGRCGSTVFHRLFSMHPRVMWLSGFCDRYPRSPAWNRWAVTMLGHAPFRRLFGGKIQPGECYRFWDTHAYGFSEPCRDLVRSDVTPRVKKQVQAALAAMLTPTRDRLLIKLAGWPRIGFLNEIFEGAKFIHIVRDGRAVASSLMHVDFWRGWRGPQGWRAGLLSTEDQAVWERFDRSFAALAALEWRIKMRALDAARWELGPSAFCEIRYEEFCERPLETYRRVLAFAELPVYRGLEHDVRDAGLKNSDRWRDDLTSEQQAVVSDVLREDLVRHGYSTG